MSDNKVGFAEFETKLGTVIGNHPHIFAPGSIRFKDAHQVGGFWARLKQFFKGEYVVSYTFELLVDAKAAQRKDGDG